MSNENNYSERKKFVMNEIKKGNLKTAYEINKETNKIKIKEEKKNAK